MTTIEAKQGYQMPDIATWRTRLGQRQYTVAFDIATVATSPDDEPQFTWYEATFDPGVPDYDAIVSSIVRSHYSDDAMTAIINNHLLGDDDDDHEAEWKEMQEWRKYAKQEAKCIVQVIEMLSPAAV